MAGLSSDLDVLKDIPGYKAILKSVLKSQIQLLIEQLSENTGEETIILTASIHDGTLSHLGSNTGKGFLDGRDEIKSQFLAFCLKSHHKKKSTEARSSPYQRPQSGPSDRIIPSQGLGHKRPRLQPVSLQRAGTGDSPGNSFTPPDIHRAPSQASSTNGQDTSSVNVKLESSEQSVSSTESTNFASSSFSLPTSILLSHTQTSADTCISDSSEVQNDEEFTEQASETDESAATSIKIEPITENEMELEITGVEPGNTPVPADSWSQVPGSSGAGDGGATNEADDQSGYKVELLSDGEVLAEETLGQFQEPSEIYSCLLCEFQDTNRGNLMRHLKDHHEKKKRKVKKELAEFCCDVCDKQFKTKHGLSLHKNSKHHLVFRFKCDTCGKGFNSLYNYKGHLASHFKVLREKCEICSATFQYKTSLQEHMRAHDRVNVFTCSEKSCTKTFSSPRAMREHRQVVHEEKRFYCSVCQQAFKWKSSRAYHEKKAH